MAKSSLGRGAACDVDVGASNSSSQPLHTKRLRTGHITQPITYMQYNQSEDEEESGSEEEEEGSDDVDGDEEDEEEEDEDEVGEYQTDQEDEGSEELDDRNPGQAISDGDTLTNDVSSGNIAGPLRTKSSMLGTFTDPDVLDCPICYDAMTIPVFQCENGHLACSHCCTKIGKKCPSCSCPIGYIRCRSIERILNSVKFSCRNLVYGCNETILYGKMEGHEKACIFAPCSCPLENCDYIQFPNNLYAHFKEKHLSSATQFYFKRPFELWLEHKHKRLILQEKTDGTIFVLNNSNNHPPQAINLICIGSLHSKEEFCYKLSVVYGNNTLKLKSVAAIMPKWSASQPLLSYLLVPPDFAFSSGFVSVTICIEKRQGSKVKHI